MADSSYDEPPVAIALTRDVSPALAVCELTHLERCSIDVGLARQQHAAYEQVLRDAGYTVHRLPATREMPDSVFIEDSAVVFDEVAILTRPGAESRRIETAEVAKALAPYRTVRAIIQPAHIDGGDVLVAGRRVFVGRSTRTNAEAVEQMRHWLAPFGYAVCEVPIGACLHLKSAVTRLEDDMLLANPQWLDMRTFRDYEVIEVDPAEPMAANVVRLRDRVIYPRAFPRTAERLASRGFRIEFVDASELAKAEGAVTCCSLIFDEDPAHG
jgi:dimethylargininase